MVAKLKDGEAVSPRVRINSRELLIFTNRGTSGREYQSLLDALDRLEG
ncbi:MAG: replication initiator protein A, partial [Pseudomonadota bacterium]